MEINLGNLLTFIDRADQATNTSLARFSKASIVQGPMFVSSRLSDEPAMKHIVSNLYNIYMGYILTSLRLSTRVDGTRTVKDILGTVSTDTRIAGASESFTDVESLVNEFSGALEVSTSHTDSKRLKVDIPTGKIIEVTFNSDSGERISMPLTIRLNPRLVPDEVTSYVVESEFREAQYNRYLRAKAGEIGFTRDFLLQLDRLERRAEALKKDRDGVMQDIYRHKNKSHLRHMLKLLHLSANNTVQANMACSVFIFDNEQIQRYTKKKGINLLKSVADRRRFFNSTYSLFCVLVDTNYSRVHLLTNGIDDVGTYSFNEMKQKTGDDDVKDFLDSFARNQLPKF